MGPLSSAAAQSMSPTPRSHPDISPELALVDPELRRVAQLLLPEPGSFARVAERKPVSAVEPRGRQERVRVPRSRPRAWTRRALLAAFAALAVVVTWPSSVGLRTPGPRLVDVDATALATTRLQPATVETGLDRAGVAGVSTAVDPRRRTNDSDSAVAPVRAHPLRTTTPKQRTIGRQPRPQQASPRLARDAARNPLPVRKARHISPRLSWKLVAGASYYNVIVWRKAQRVLDLWPSVNRVLLPESWTHQGKSRTLSPGRYLWFVYAGFGARADARYGEPVQGGILVIDRK
jgi:hypothetical protein